MTEEYLQVVTMTDSEREAEEIGRTAVDARLAAAAQISSPVTSIYWWRGTVERTAEWACVLKTTADRFNELVEHIRAHHHYEVPEITATTISRGNDDYLNWLRTETAQPAARS